MEKLLKRVIFAPNEPGKPLHLIKLDYEKLPKELPPSPKVVLQKEYIFSDKPLTVSAKLDKGVYSQGDEMQLQGSNF